MDHPLPWDGFDAGFSEIPVKVPRDGDILSVLMAFVHLGIKTQGPLGHFRRAEPIPTISSCLHAEFARKSRIIKHAGDLRQSTSFSSTSAIRFEPLRNNAPSKSHFRCIFRWGSCCCLKFKPVRLFHLLYVRSNSRPHKTSWSIKRSCFPRCPGPVTMPFDIAPGGQPGIKYPIRTPLSSYVDNRFGTTAISHQGATRQQRGLMQLRKITNAAALP
jgi:hypothetical protein